MSQPCKKCQERVYLGIGHTCSDTTCCYHVPVAQPSPSRARPSDRAIAQAFWDMANQANRHVRADELASSIVTRARELDTSPEARAGDCLPVHPHVRGRTLLTLLWQKYDAGGISMGRSFESVVLEAAMDLFDDFRDQVDVNRCDGNSEVINETRTYLSQQRLLREGLTTKATP